MYSTKEKAERKTIDWDDLASKIYPDLPVRRERERREQPEQRPYETLLGRIARLDSPEYDTDKPDAKRGQRYAASGFGTFGGYGGYGSPGSGSSHEREFWDISNQITEEINRAEAQLRNQQSFSLQQLSGLLQRMQRLLSKYPDATWQGRFDGYKRRAESLKSRSR